MIFVWDFNDLSRYNSFIGLALACAFVVYDTQLIAEKSRRGDDDYIWHAVELFMDFANIFRLAFVLRSYFFFFFSLYFLGSRALRESGSNDAIFSRYLIVLLADKKQRDNRKRRD